MSLTKTKAWVAGTVVLCLVVSLAAWFLLISPQRAEAAETRKETVTTAAANRALELKITELKAQFAELPQRQAELAAIKQAMPEDAQLPTLVRDLDALATAAGVTLMALTPSTPVALAGPGAPVVAPAEPAAAEGSETASPTPGTAPPADATVVTPSADTLAAIPVEVTVVGNFYNVEVFLRSVQTELSRDYLVQGLSVTAEDAADAQDGKPAVKNGDVTMLITGSVFVLRTADDAVAGTSVDPTPSAPSSSDS